ncbi:MAG: TonB-dependent receptor, partial [Betaproteobacteria bacterium]|nr:TonB-dependent receptor [Betaproteobacteria bacterium]
MSVDPNGAGGQETQNISIRGFQDGQFNVTFDGIPIGDTNDFTHHSTSFFMNQDIKGLVVDRGPGDASNIGYATFGGTVAVSTVDPSQNAGVTPFGSFGTWNTKLAGVQFDTGNLQKYGDAKAYFSYKNFSTDGFLTNSGQNRQNLFVKFDKPLSDYTTVTFVATTNKVHQNVSYGATLGAIAQNGLNYGLSNDPNTQNFYGYNIDNIQTDIEYLGIKSRIGEWNIDNKTYTYAYYHQGLNGGPGGGAYSEYPYYSLNGGATLNNGTQLPNDITGNLLNNNYRSWGDILRLSKNYKTGELDTGIWIDRQSNDKTLTEVDWSQNGAFNYNFNSYSNASLNYADTLGNETITTIQPYLQYKYNVNSNWQVTPGVKYSSFNRDTNFPVLNGNYPGNISNATYTRFLKNLSTRYLINQNWSVYGDYSEGFLAPKLQLLQTSPPTNPGTINPERTENYQVGTTWKDRNNMLGFDVYKILTYDTSIAQTQGGQTVYQPVG